MVPPQSALPPPKAMVFWIIWFAILNGLVIIQLFAGGGIPSGPNQGETPMLLQFIAVGLATAAMAVRFMVIPRAKSITSKLPAMIIGLALSEAVGIMGAFVIDKRQGATRLTLFVLSILCIVAFAPVYASSADSDGPYQR